MSASIKHIDTKPTISHYSFPLTAPVSILLANRARPDEYGAAWVVRGEGVCDNAVEDGGDADCREAKGLLEKRLAVRQRVLPVSADALPDRSGYKFAYQYHTEYRHQNDGDLLPHELVNGGVE